ncbi:MAG: Asp-tRNA(Asn)/Glu-tRNA(Gln) amidotransferase subunit GatA [Gammaproteobacteria bacterium]|nr:Asp-tRNA(Asn)/Glu-tRNA(Gln) amidotransferase subunit GatA [Gammaproteobacteria bacterium]MBU6509254.1 Asp-tRNA(Asn)/Glu-tRNA(Gln) amidotransferase subunit GatA [Gammaproteobacteria bacterium]MDE1983195.1 Asp-tRNA(Asn)/Glu-tRNA(Gln) amidotransferase subunit GatA [Gammaproteobacteria bacterium]
MLTQTLAELSRDLKARKVSSAEVTSAYLARIQRFNPQINAFITVLQEQALAEARAADARIAKGDAHLLTGVPIAHKDIFCTAGVKTSCGSKMLDNFVAPYDAHIVTRLKQAGSVLLGKTNMDEFAMGSSNETSFYGPVKNPWDSTRVPGGSSGGSAAVVAARLACAATGTDTGGSIRQPAALVGLTGVKPTYGRVSRYGMIAFASSLDQAGVIAYTAEDAALLLSVIAGFDPRDSTSVDRPVPDYAATLEQPIRGLRIGVPREFFDPGLDRRVAEAVQTALSIYKKLGARVQDISLPNFGLSVPTYYVVAPAEASSNLSRFDGVRFGHRCGNPVDLMDLYTRSRGEGFGAEVKRRIMTGTYVLSAGYYDAYYLKAQKTRALIRRDFLEAFTHVDVIMGPTTPTPAFRLGEKTDDPVTMYLNDIYANGVNLAGLPGLSIPMGFVDGLPVGLQIIGNYFDEARMLGVAHQYQRETDWHRQVPKGFE